jgi:hypothetical protein
LVYMVLWRPEAGAEVPDPPERFPGYAVVARRR